MRTCAGCGGILGRDCFNESECVWITQSMEQQENPPEKDYEELHKLSMEINVRDLHIDTLSSALKEFLKVINRSPAALYHYGDAIKMAENALGITPAEATPITPPFV